ncbi:hypothetical protein BCR41DRAFT_414675 [Lobosporangium transversale]|uniref:Uncharacterized protein n=1 Tax=Lobosporangium transversale TaxID=64571 RepID=A0A1Y2G9C3_9FUNG|nr:hypothetical protein BCR41DRAFT_414675 [Lobosporangium transversale]ORZ02009.1 hypothetical protein BCR41DRAFT_414675 [Lobosporangium transversale]|eukprot:XP_021876237.1 hypothetical protein BCR41DRAFT_414675 [Lobosporangium transversale]
MWTWTVLYCLYNEQASPSVIRKHRHRHRHRDKQHTHVRLRQEKTYLKQFHGSLATGSRVDLCVTLFRPFNVERVGRAEDHPAPLAPADTHLFPFIVIEKKKKSGLLLWGVFERIFSPDDVEMLSCSLGLFSRDNGSNELQCCGLYPDGQIGGTGPVLSNAVFQYKQIHITQRVGHLVKGLGDELSCAWDNIKSHFDVCIAENKDHPMAL